MRVFAGTGAALAFAGALLLTAQVAWAGAGRPTVSATAADDETPHNAPCATASLDGFRMSGRVPYDYPILRGQVTRCDDDPAPEFAMLTRFGVEGAGEVKGYIRYDPGGRPAEFYAPIPFSYGDDMGLCVNSSLDVRLACARLTLVSSDPRTWRLETIPVNDPRVARQATLPARPSGLNHPTPVCGGCFAPPVFGPDPDPAPTPPRGGV